MSDLTRKDIDNLCDALEAWETKDSIAGLFGGIMTSMLSKDVPPEMVEEMKKMDREREEERERKMRERKEVSVMLRAKLINMKQQSIFDEASKIVNKS